MLSGVGSLAELNDGTQRLLVRNSLLIARDDLFILKNKNRAASPGMGVDFEQSTLVAGRAHFAVDCDEGSGGVRGFADSCLFAGLKWEKAKGAGACLLQYNGELSLKAISWQENRCGYDERIHQYLIDSTKRSDEKQDFSQTWVNQWGENGVKSPFVEPGGISYQDGASSRDIRLTSASYALTPESAANRVGVNQLPIGAGNITIGSGNRKNPNVGTKTPALPPKPPVKRPVGGL
ncbi:MAG: hypothetical protein KDA68_08720 [Planctomycetaceae bacterium]|nr:hypothetical protein [Planctomycetaceae bacterium]